MGTKLSFARDREQIFHRTELAEDLLRRLVDPAYKSGLFLSAPRRTGKTTFIKSDLLPMLEEAGAIVIYADLWEQKSLNPAKVVTTAIADAILHEAGHVTKFAKAVGLKKVKVGGLEMDLECVLPMVSIESPCSTASTRCPGALDASSRSPIPCADRHSVVGALSTDSMCIWRRLFPSKPRFPWGLWALSANRNRRIRSAAATKKSARSKPRSRFGLRRELTNGPSVLLGNIHAKLNYRSLMVWHFQNYRQTHVRHEADFTQSPIEIPRVNASETPSR